MDIRQRIRRGHRPALVAALLLACLACAFGGGPARAQLPPVPEITVPPLPIDGQENSTPESTSTTTTAPSSPTTAPPATTAPVPTAGTSAGASPASSATTGASETTRRADSAVSPRGSNRTRTAPVAEETFDVAPAAAEQEPTIARLRQVTLPAARQFGFPLGLAALVLAFLAMQGRLDARDPKLAIAPLSVDDDLLPFT